MKLSATIITFNEGKNIARALKSLEFADEIIVVDSFSTDDTKAICHTFANVKFIENKFDGYGQQKNFAINQCQNEWILNVDADEEISAELKNDILHIIKNNKADCNLYAINRLTSFCGQWIYHGGWYPHYLTRLGKKDYIRWTEPEVHENLILQTQGDIGKIHAPLLHYSFPTVKSQLDTNIKYAWKGARELIKNRKRRPTLLEVLIRPIGKFFECYIVKLGILDRTAGLVIAINAAYSMFMKYSIAYWDNIDE